MVPLLRILIMLPDICFDALKPNNDIIFLRKLPQPCNQFHRICNINKKYAEKQPDEKGKRQIFRQPLQRGQDMRMDKQAVDCAHRQPEQRKLRTDDALQIAPFPAVVPQPYMDDL